MVGRAAKALAATAPEPRSRGVTRLLPGISYGLPVKKHARIGWIAAVAVAASVVTAGQAAEAAPTEIGAVTPISSVHGFRPDLAYNPERDEFLGVWNAGTPMADLTAVRLDGNGAPIGGTFELGPAPGADDKFRVRVAYNPDADEYLTVWSDDIGSIWDDGRVGLLYARRVSATGTPIGGVLQLTPKAGTGYFCGYHYADVTYHPGTGGYAVAAQLRNDTLTPNAACPGLAAGTSQLRVWTLDAQGAVSGSAPVAAAKAFPADLEGMIAGNPVTGELLVGWHAHRDDSVDGSPTGTVVQRLTAGLAAAGAPVVIAEATDKNPGRRPFAAADPLTGNWLVGAGIYPTGTIASLLSPTGAVLSGPNQLQTGTSAYSVAATGTGQWVLGDESGGLSQVGANGLEVGLPAEVGYGRETAVAFATGSSRALAIWHEGGKTVSAVVGLHDGFQALDTPTRILDTRTGVGAPARQVGSEQVIDLKVTGVGGVPAGGVDAVVLNLTAANATVAGYVTAWPTGQPQPGASVLNVLPGVATPNLVVAKVGEGGFVSLYNNGGPIDLIGDVAGWYATNDGVVAVTPDRLLDTRSGIGAPAGAVGHEGVVELQVTGRGGVPDSGVDAVVLNVTAVGGTGSGYVTAWPTGRPRPEASALNVQPDIATPNLVVAKVGDGGKVSLYNYGGDVHLLADVAGWYPSGGGLTSLTPTRVLDTRTGVGAPAAAVGPAGVISVRVAGQGGVPATGAGTVVLNVTATQGTATSYVTAWPAGAPQPNSSVLNIQPGVSRPNLVFAKLGSDGAVSLFNESGEVHLLADVVAWMPA